MTIQVVDIIKPPVFKYYSEKYNIFRDLYDLSACAIEIRDCEDELAKKIYKLFLDNKELAYLKESNEHTNLFILGPFKELLEISKTLKSDVNEDIGFKLYTSLNNYSNHYKKSMSIANKQFSFNDVHIVGILNVTPDSFSDGGKFIEFDKAVKHANEMLDEGASIIDIGGESTRPGSESISVFEELKRVIPVIESIKSERPDALISIDTTKSEVAKEALSSGASIVNDISGLTFDPNMIQTVVEKNAALILMHIQGTPKTMQENPQYENVVGDVFNFLSMQTEKAVKAGIRNIIIDPGFGFGKTVEHNFELLSRLDDFRCLGFPIMAGLSRKSMLGKSLNLPVDNRDNATIIAETIAVNKGATFIRTHNVKNAVQLKNLVKLIKQPGTEVNV